MEFYYATFPEAVKILIGAEGEGRQKSCPAPSKDLSLIHIFKDSMIDVVKNVFNLILKYFIDEISEGSV